MIYHVDTVSPGDSLTRHLGLFDAVVIGLASMIGAGVFAALGPAARAAGPGLLIGLGIAALIAFCNAMSSARLAALYPESGGTYIYGQRRLGDFWGYLAGWAFIVGKTASCAAMALTVASYLAPHEVRAVALATVIALTAMNALGIQKSAWATRLIVCVVLLCLGLVVVGCLAGGQARLSHLRPFPGGGVHGILQSAGLLFFAFAGYARIATLGEEVRDPRRTIGRAIPIALGMTLVVYGVVAISALLAVGASGIGGSAAPLRAAVEAGNLHSLGPAVQVGGALAAIGSLIALILGVSRTALAMSRDGYLPSALAVHPRGVPVRAELAVGVVVAVLVASVDLRGAVGFSSFGVLVYYGIANASAWTLTREEQALPRWLPVLGILGCVVLAVSLPSTSALAGAGVLAVGVVWWFVRSGIATRRSRTPRRSPAE
jgi:APA family basic amino acid/polyamine antiporter